MKHLGGAVLGLGIALLSCSRPAVEPASAPASTDRTACVAARDAYESFLRTHQGCAADAECDALAPGCGLTAPRGVGVNRASKKRLAELRRDFGTCWGLLGGVCPTCPVPSSVPRCVSGECVHP